MYNIENNFEMYLFDKETQSVVKTFKSMYEVRSFLKENIKNSIKITDLNPFPWSETAKLNDLSMSFDILYETILEHTPYWNSVTSCISYMYKETEHMIKKYVILDKNGHIFNYTEIVAELIAYERGTQINFGIGKTYSGNPNMEMSYENKIKNDIPTYVENYSDYLYKHIKFWNVDFGHLIVNKSERIKTINISNSFCKDISDEIFEEFDVDIDPYMISKAYNCMRKKRRLSTKKFYGKNFTDRYYKIGSAESWKNHKKSKQWKKNKHTEKQTAQKDYIKKYIDEGYSYDYSDDN